MAGKSTAEMARRPRTSGWAHVVERIGLAMTGASCGVFVAAYVFNTAGVEIVDPVTFACVMLVYGAIGFYLGIDIPPLPRTQQPDLSDAPAAEKADPTEVLSAAGTIIAATASLVSVYVLVFDAVLPRVWAIVIGFCWLFGVTMQIGAGMNARLRKADPTIG
jgi:uncharacterized membrane protein